MDPKVYGELPTHHRRGHGVDEEALRIRIPLRQGTRTCPRWDLAEIEACGGGKVLSMISLFFGIFREYVGATPKAEGVQGAHKPVGRDLPPGRRVGACGAPEAPLPWLPSFSIFFLSGKKNSGIFFRLDSVTKSPVKGVKNMEKTGTGTLH